MLFSRALVMVASWLAIGLDGWTAGATASRRDLRDDFRALTESYLLAGTRPRQGARSVTDLAHRIAIDDATVAQALERHRPGLTAHCYRMLGSAFEAEDALQETFIRAWRGFARFEGRAELRSWLYRIATNVCLNMLNGRARRALPMSLVPPSSGESDLGAPITELAWVTPVPDRQVMASHMDPADAVATRDNIRLAFIAALQHLQPKPRAVLLLRDVLGWHADEVAAALDTS